MATNSGTSNSRQILSTRGQPGPPVLNWDQPTFEHILRSWWRHHNYVYPHPQLVFHGMPEVLSFFGLFEAVIFLGGAERVKALNLWSKVEVRLRMNSRPPLPAVTVVQGQALLPPPPQQQRTIAPLPGGAEFLHKIFDQFLAPFLGYTASALGAARGRGACVRSLLELCPCEAHHRIHPYLHHGCGCGCGQPRPSPPPPHWQQPRTPARRVSGAGSPLVCFAHVSAETLRAMGLPEIVILQVEMGRAALQRQHRHRPPLLRLPQQVASPNGCTEQSFGLGSHGARLSTGAGANGLPESAEPRITNTAPARSTQRWADAITKIANLKESYKRARDIAPSPLLALEISEKELIIHNFDAFEQLGAALDKVLPVFCYLGFDLKFIESLVKSVQDLVYQRELLQNAVPTFIFTSSSLKSAYLLSIVLLDMFRKLARYVRQKEPRDSITSIGLSPSSVFDVQNF